MDSRQTITNRTTKYGPTDLIRTKCWVYGVKLKSKLTTFTDIERALLPDTFHRRKDIEVGGLVYPCAFCKYSNGTKFAIPKHIALADVAYTGTRAIYDHPFWDLIKLPENDVDKINSLLIKLRCNVAELIFHQPHSQTKPFRRKLGDLGNLLNRLDKESDLDALAACIALLLEYKHSYLEVRRISRKIIRIFHRAVSQHPLYFVSEELFSYIKRNYLIIPDDDKWNDYINRFNLENMLEINNFILNIIDDLSILKHFTQPPLTCLYLSEKYITGDTYETIFNLAFHGRYREISQLPEIKRMARCLRKWEKTVVNNITNKNHTYISHNLVINSNKVSLYRNSGQLIMD